MTEKITFEDVLDELMLEEPKPDYAALVRWRERYPRYRKELAEFFATWSVQEHLEKFAPEVPIDEEKLVDKGVAYGMEILRRQGRILERREAEAPLDPFDQIILTAIYLLHGDAHVVNVTERASRMLGREVLLGSTFASLGRLQQRYLIIGMYGNPETEPGGKMRRYSIITVAGERALAMAKATIPAVAKALEDFA